MIAQAANPFLFLCMPQQSLPNYCCITSTCLACLRINVLIFIVSRPAASPRAHGLTSMLQERHSD